MADVKVVREWLSKADEDLNFAKVNLEEGNNFYAQICFHFQQAAEKYLKAFLVALEKPFPKTHDIESLISLMPKDIRLALTVEEQRRLTEYATVLRYPGPYEAIPLSEAKQAVKLAQRVQRKIRKLLEKKPLF